MKSLFGVDIFEEDPDGTTYIERPIRGNDWDRMPPDLRTWSIRVRYIIIHNTLYSQVM